MGMDSAKEWYDDEDAAKVEREEEVERERLAREAEEAYEARDRSIWKLESQIADLQGELDGMQDEIDEYQGMYDGLTEEEVEAGDGAEFLESIETLEGEYMGKEADMGSLYDEKYHFI